MHPRRYIHDDDTRTFKDWTPNTINPARQHYSPDDDALAPIQGQVAVRLLRDGEDVRLLRQIPLSALVGLHRRHAVHCDGSQTDTDTHTFIERCREKNTSTFLEMSKPEYVQRLSSTYCTVHSYLHTNKHRASNILDSEDT